MSQVIRVRRLRKDGNIDRVILVDVAAMLKDNIPMVLPVDGLYGFARICSGPTVCDRSLETEAELLVSGFGVLERWVSFSKADYDFLKRVWPDEVSVILSPRDGEGPIVVRMPQSPVSNEILALSGGSIEFTPILNPKGKPSYKISDIENAAAKAHVNAIFLIDEWCKPHPLPTVIDIRQGVPRLVKSGRVSMEEISSLYHLGPSE